MVSTQSSIQPNEWKQETQGLLKVRCWLLTKEMCYRLTEALKTYALDNWNWTIDINGIDKVLEIFLAKELIAWRCLSTFHLCEKELVSWKLLIKRELLLERMLVNRFDHLLEGDEIIELWAKIPRQFINIFYQAVEALIWLDTINTYINILDNYYKDFEKQVWSNYIDWAEFYNSMNVIYIELDMLLVLANKMIANNWLEYRKNRLFHFVDIKINTNKNQELRVFNDSWFRQIMNHMYTPLINYLNDEHWKQKLIENFWKDNLEWFNKFWQSIQKEYV